MSDVKQRPIKASADATDWLVVQSNSAGLGDEKRVQISSLPGGGGSSLKNYSTITEFTADGGASGVGGTAAKPVFFGMSGQWYASNGSVHVPVAEVPVEAYNLTGSLTDAEMIQAALDANTGNIVRFQKGKTYTFRNVEIKNSININTNGAILQYGGTNGTLAPLEGVPVHMYAEASAGNEIEYINIYGYGTFKGIRAGISYDEIAVGAHDAIQFNYVNRLDISQLLFQDIIQDPITVANIGIKAEIHHNNFFQNGDASIEGRINSVGTIEIHNNHVKKCRHLYASKNNVNNVIIRDNYAETHDAGVIIHGSRQKLQRNYLNAYVSDDGRDGRTKPAVEIRDLTIPAPLAIEDILIEDLYTTGRDQVGGAGVTTSANVAFELKNLKIRGGNINARAGISLAIGKDVSIENVTVNASASLAIQSTSAVDDLKITGGQYTSAGSAICLSIASTNNKISGVKATSQTGAAIQISSTATKTKVSKSILVSGTAAVTNFADGTELDMLDITTTAGAGISSTKRVRVYGGNIAAAAEGINLLAGADKSKVIGTEISQSTQGVRLAANNCVLDNITVTAAQFFGVNISAGATDNTIENSILTGNASGAITDAGTRTRKINNITAASAPVTQFTVTAAATYTLVDASISTDSFIDLQQASGSTAIQIISVVCTAGQAVITFASSNSETFKFRINNNYF